MYLIKAKYSINSKNLSQEDILQKIQIISMSNRPVIVGELNDAIVKKTTISQISSDLILISIQVDVDRVTMPEDVIFGIIELNLKSLASLINQKLMDAEIDSKLIFIDFSQNHC